MIRPRTGLQLRQGICVSLWFVVWMALSAGSPESVKSHNSLPIIQQGLDTTLQPAGLLEVKKDNYVHLTLFNSCFILNSYFILDMFVESAHGCNSKMKEGLLTSHREVLLFFWRDGRISKDKDGNNAPE